MKNYFLFLLRKLGFDDFHRVEKEIQKGYFYKYQVQVLYGPFVDYCLKE